MTARWFRPDVSRQRALRDNLPMALLVVPALAVLLLLLGAERTSVIRYTAMWALLTLAAGLVRFLLRRRKEAARG